MALGTLAAHAGAGSARSGGDEATNSQRAAVGVGQDRPAISDGNGNRERPAGEAPGTRADDLAAAEFVLAQRMYVPTDSANGRDTGTGSGRQFSSSNVSASVGQETLGGWATTYGSSYEGKVMGCGGTYHDADPDIAAVGPAYFDLWPCGTMLRVCGIAGCVETIRRDACPGCVGRGAWVDLSAAGIAQVCGEGSGSCRATVEVMGRVR